MSRKLTDHRLYGYFRTALKGAVYMCGLWLNVAFAFPLIFISQEEWEQYWDAFHAWAEELWRM